MKKWREDSDDASALRVTLAIALLFVVAVLFAFPFTSSSLSNPEQTTGASGITVSLLVDSLDNQIPSNTVFLKPVTTTNIDPTLLYVGFQADFTFNENVVTFSSPFVEPAGLTATGWNVSGNILPGTGPSRTLRVSAFSLDFTPLSGSGVLYNLRMLRVGETGSTPLNWQPDPDHFVFIDDQLKTHVPTQTNGSISITGVTPTPTPTPMPCTPFSMRERFDNITTLVPGGWFMQNNSQPGPGTTNWFQGDASVFNSYYSFPTNSYITANFNNGSDTSIISNWLLTPPLPLENGLIMTFWTRTVATPSFPDRLQVRLSTNGTSTNVGTSATDVGDFGTLLLDNNPTYSMTGYPNAWTPFTVTVSGLPSPTTGRLALRYFVENGGSEGSNSDYIGIDQVQITGPCPPTPTPSPQPTPTSSPLPGIGISPNTGPFGSKVVGSSSSPIQFTVFRNLSSMALNASLSDATNFTITQNTCSQPGGVCFVSVKFNPLTAGPKTTSLTMTSPGCCSAVVTLTGTGRPLSATPAPTPSPTLTPTATPIPTATICGSFSNSASITVPASGNGGVGSPYPSNINVSGLGGAITKITVAINGCTHTAPADIDVLLVGPTGQNAIIMSDVRGYFGVTGLNLVLDDAATNFLPKCNRFFCPNGGFVSGTYRPTNNQECDDGTAAIDTFPAPAPSPRGGTPLSLFNGTNPNGIWSLYVLDDEGSQHAGSFSGGWAITISTDNCNGPTPTPKATPTLTPGPTHFRINAPSFLPIPGPITFTVTARDASEQIVNYLGTLHFTSSNPFAQLPPDTGLTNGTGTFTANFGDTFIGHTITATDTVNFHLTGTSNCVVLGDSTPTPTPTPTLTPSTPSPTPALTPTIAPDTVSFVFQNFDQASPPTLPWATSFTNGAANCTPTGTCTLGTNWVASTINPIEGPISAFHDAPGCVTDSVMQTPSFFVPPDIDTVEVEFLHNFDLESGRDGGVLEISYDGGSFVDIVQAGGFANYNGTISTGFLSPIAGRNAWTGTGSGFGSALLPVSAIGHTMRLRFRLATDCSGSGVGWRVDRVYIHGHVSHGGTPFPTPTPSPTPSTPTPTPSTPCPKCTPTPTPTSSPTPTSTLTPTPTPAEITHALNLSTRLRVETGTNVGIGGFIITGTNPRQVLLRGIGPSLTGVGQPLANPILELHGPGGFVTVTNNNWRDSQEADIIATGIPPTNDLESAILATLDPGVYTAILSGNNNGTGTGLVEIYDLSQGNDSTLANISTRAFVSTGSDIVIAGFILGDGANDDRILVRGIGPSLAAAGVPNALANPTLELRDGEGTLVAANDDWQNGPPVSLPPTDSSESAIEATLSPGAYTALLFGVNDGTGVGLVEVYNLGLP